MKRPIYFHRALPIIIYLAAGLTGCARFPVWQAPAEVLITDYTIALTLNDFEGGGTSNDFDSKDIPNLPAPKGLRPCCAFGNKLKVKLGEMPLAGFKLDNIRASEDLGPHKFDNGLVSLDLSDNRGWVDDENNGLVYTCRGGFIDIAHVRDNADMTIFLAAEAGRNMDVGGVSNMPDQGGKIRVVFHPVAEEILDEHGRLQLAARIGQWVAFQLSIWHEIVTWYGFASMDAWPEKLSSFSPEDLYSNLLGVKIAGAIITSMQASDDYTYNRSMDNWIKRVLNRLQAVSREDGIEAIDRVDGIWWDSQRPLPDWQITLRRHFLSEKQIKPWLISMAGVTLDACVTAKPRLDLLLPSAISGTRFDELATIEIDVDNELIKNGFPLLATDQRTVTQADFSRLAETIRSEVVEVLGSKAGQPEP
ncbi:DUF4056 domain-containing protein [Methyloprofundus sedimenti]|uniref:DUF4056 domain-containing protein n=1 Tax=Methyloprofundus sedimenti TaxID=1420851 RepID=UPI001301BFB5|nr:DUF4056 domain-containing protein [Methyloprofundus sedimenti]